MNYDEYGWRKFLTEARKPAKKPKMYTEQKLLRELEEDEYELIRDAIDTMGPEELAFNELFGGKTRLILDFKAFDETSDMGKFAKVFQNQGYTVDWEKGMVYAEREVSPKSATDDIMAAITGARVEKRKKKIQMKIGKLFAKIADIARRQNELLAIIQKKMTDNRPEPQFGMSSRPPSHPGAVTGNQAADAFNAEQLENWKRLHKQMYLYIPNPGLWDGGYAARNAEGATTTAEQAVSFGLWWRDNAEYVKKNMDKLYSDRYSIIVTRNPVDVFRMSDFDNITSCHSPPSRPQSSESYFQCAVAEAHGHGAIAYVVNTEDLIKWSGRTDYTMEELEDEIDGDMEIFRDDARQETSSDGMITPLSRVRLRQVRAFEDRSAVAEGGGKEIAVPETRVYGLRIPGFRDRVFQWAKESQSEAISTLSADKGFLVKYGGSYEDNNIKGLIQDLTGIEYPFVGQNTETEDSLPENELIQGAMRHAQEEVERLMDYWNNQYQACNVTGEVTEDYDGGFYISVSAEMNIDWEIGEWESLPQDGKAVGYWMSELNDFEWNWANADSYSNRLFKYSNDTIRLTIQMDEAEVQEEGVYDPDTFEDFCIEVNRIDDMYDAVYGEISRMAKRDGYMEGGAINEWGSDIDNGSVDYYEWDMTANEEDHMTYVEIEGSHTAYPDAPDGMSAQDARTILESRDFTIPMRKALVEKAWAGTEVSEDDRQYPDFRVYTEDLRSADGTSNIKLVLTFSCYDHSSDAQVKSMRWTVEEWEDEDELDAAIQAVFNQVVGENIPATDDRVEDTPPAQTTNESIVKNWKNFLYS
tara:strand:- start:2002 stop:4434 length:2433 start_codon:yes stop_codon:yes gene_type:complete